MLYYISIVLLGKNIRSGFYSRILLFLEHVFGFTISDLSTFGIPLRFDDRLAQEALSIL